MLKTWVGSLARVSLSSGTLGADEKTADISTWRWRVSGVLDAQRARELRPSVERVDFQQRHDLYATNGMPDAK